MCGITAGVAARDIAPILVESLRRLEYRGYDSAGLAVINLDNPVQGIQRIRAQGKVEQLAKAILQSQSQATFIHGHTGIAHTRWATHGQPNEINAHPHMYQDKIALVHNGIIENYLEIKKELKNKGIIFSSETDSEVIVQAIGLAFEHSQDLYQAVITTLSTLRGAYSLAVMSCAYPDRIIAARRGAPLILGIGIGEHFVASDMLALLPFTQTMIVLEEGDVAILYRDSYEIYDSQGQRVQRIPREVVLNKHVAELGAYRHFMQKEIFEQPEAISSAIEGRLGEASIDDAIFGVGAKETFDKVKAVQIVACGTSYHAGLVAKQWLEQLAEIPTQVEIASELRGRKSLVQPGTLFLTLSQSGETADTLAALRSMDSPNYCGSLTICNVPESSLVRESDHVLLTHAGPEVGVASTKAFTAQLTALLMLVAVLGRRHALTPAMVKNIVDALRQLPALAEKTLGLDVQIAKLATHFAHKHHTLFLGRGIHYPIAMEAALKLKEISYIHAEAYPAGELKHGPLALVDKDMPVVFLIPSDHLYEKNCSNIQEVLARGGELIAFSDEGRVQAEGLTYPVINLPKAPSILSPILFTLPLQLLAYHVALQKGTDVDRPRNLAKCVTVE